jgi:hypothetical protein
VITATLPSNLPHLYSPSRPLGKFGKMKPDPLIGRVVDANDRRIRDEARQSDARIGEKFQDTKEEHYLFIGSQRLTVRARDSS